MSNPINYRNLGAVVEFRHKAIASNYLNIMRVNASFARELNAPVSSTNLTMYSEALKQITATTSQSEVPGRFNVDNMLRQLQKYYPLEEFQK
jgi:vacuolar-type H+-ATPase subunit B/Vma2